MGMNYVKGDIASSQPDHRGRQRRCDAVIGKGGIHYVVAQGIGLGEYRRTGSLKA